MQITSQTRFESYQKLDKKHMYEKILYLLGTDKGKSEGYTAREAAQELFAIGVIRDNTRQATAPRFTELMDMGKIQVVGIRLDSVTAKNVSVYMLV